jgi:MYXO-CTERM domain-containing protein
MRAFAVVGLLALVACEGTREETTSVTPVLGAEPQMVGGTISGAAQDMVIDLVMGDSSCTATLIAPDLLITAHHCVAAENDDANAPACSPLGDQVDPSTLEVKLNTVSQQASDDATFNSKTVARGKQIWVPTTNNICSFDVALVKLDTQLTKLPIANIRFSALKTSESVTAVGFGTNGHNVETLQRMQRNTTVLGIGPTTVQFESQGDGTIPLSLPKGDVMTGESHCFGDSGGPLFDKDGNIVAIISRGPDDAPDDNKHGPESCLDMAETYAGVASNEDFIRTAAKSAGHELSSGPVASTQKGAATSNPTTSAKKTSSTSTGDDDDDDSTSSKTTSGLNQTASAGCSSSPGASSASGWLLVLAAIAATRRRRA